MPMMGWIHVRLVEHGYGYDVHDQEDGTIIYSSPYSKRSVVLSNENGRVGVTCENGEFFMLINDEHLVDNILKILDYPDAD